MLEPLKLLQPTTVAEASKALADLGEQAKVYAGGAELLLLLRQGLLRTEVLVDVKKIERLHRVSWDKNVLTVGACVTHHALQLSSAVRGHAPSFAFAESQVANVRVRNQGTLGGNLCFNDPHSDPGTVLLMHNATVTLGSHRGERQVTLDDFFLDMYATVLEPDELLIEVNIPPLRDGMKSAYLRLHRYQRPTLGIAVAVRSEKGTILETRLAVGCVGPKAQRLSEVESNLEGAKLNDVKKILASKKKYVREFLRPVDDLLGSAEYKIHMTCTLLETALDQAAHENGRRY